MSNVIRKYRDANGKVLVKGDIVKYRNGPAVVVESILGNNLLLIEQNNKQELVDGNLVKFISSGPKSRPTTNPAFLPEEERAEYIRRLRGRIFGGREEESTPDYIEEEVFESPAPTLIDPDFMIETEEEKGVTGPNYYTTGHSAKIVIWTMNVSGYLDDSVAAYNSRIQVRQWNGRFDPLDNVVKV